MSSNPSPAVAALLSFLFPGAGQIYAGETRRGLLWAIPMLVFVIAVVMILLGGTGSMLGLVGTAPKRLALLTINVAFFLYHLAAMFDAYGIAQRQRYRSFGGFGGAAPIILAALVSLTIVMHGIPEAYGVQIHNSYTAIAPDDPPDVIPPFSPGTLPTPGPATPTPITTPSPQPTPSPSASGSVGTPGPSGTPGGSPPPRTPPPEVNLANWPIWAQDNRLNILVVGTDSRSDTGVDDNSLRTDTMLLLSIDIQAGKAAMFSFPRNMCSAADGACEVGTRYPEWLKIPLSSDVLSNPAAQAAFPNGTYSGQCLGRPGIAWNALNSMWYCAAGNPDVFPGSDGVTAQDCSQQYTCNRAWLALSGTIQEMTAVPIDGIVSVNLKGFVSLVDNLPPTCPPRAVRVALTNAECYGGVWLDVPETLHDDVYHTSTGQLIEIDIEAGCQFFDGEMALAYSRSRHESSDYDRARRQQYVLTQVRKQLEPLALLPHIPQLLLVAEQNLFMSFSGADVQFLAEAASRIDPDRIYRYDFAPSKVAAVGSMQGIRDKVNNIFSEPEPEPEEQPNAPRCPPRPGS